MNDILASPFRTFIFDQRTELREVSEDRIQLVGLDTCTQLGRRSIKELLLGPGSGDSG